METQLYSVRVGKFDDHSYNLDHIFTENWGETVNHKSIMALKPNYDQYRIMENADALSVLYAYYGDEVVGYSYNILSNHHHYDGLRMASNDVLFVSPHHRNSPVGLKLIRETEREVKRRGAKLVMWTAKGDTALDVILLRMGCKLQELVYSKEL